MYHDLIGDHQDESQENRFWDDKQQSSWQLQEGSLQKEQHIFQMLLQFQQNEEK